MEEVGVAEEDAAQFQVDNQSREQFVHRRLGMLNQFEPHTYVLDMVLVHRELPILANEHIAWSNEAKGDEFLLEVVDNLLHLGLVDINDLEAQCELEVEHGRHIVGTQFLGEVEDGVDEGYQLILRHLIDGVAHHTVHIPDKALALVLHAGQVK